MVTAQDDDEVESAPSLRRAAATGVAWTLAGQIAVQAIRFVVLLLLARMLVPRDFGLLAMITVITGFADLLVDVGLGAALVQRRELTSRHIGTALTLNTAVGLFLGAVLAACAPLISTFYGEHQLLTLTLAMSAEFPITALGIVPHSLLLRELRLRPVVLAESGAFAVAGAVAVTAAQLGAGTWALVMDLLLANVLTSAALWLLSRRRPHWSWGKAESRDLWRFGSGVLGFSTVNYWARNADDLIIGKVLGTYPLGLYTRAYSLLLFPLTQVSQVLGRVMFPTLSRMQHDRERLRRVYLRTLGVIALVTFPVMTVVSISAGPVLEGLLGHQWLGAEPVLRILAIVGAIQSLGTTTGWLYQATGQTRRMFIFGLISSVFTIGAFVVGVQWGITGVAWAYAVRTLLNFSANVSVAGRIVGISLANVLAAVMFPLAFTTAITAYVWPLQSLALPGLNPLTQVALAGLAAATGYLLLCVIVRPQPVRELAAAVASMRGAPAQRPLTLAADTSEDFDSHL